MADKPLKTPHDGPVPDPHADKPAPRPEHTRDAPDADVARPDQHEELGPVAELFDAAVTEAAAEATGDEDLQQKAIEKGAEAEGVESAQILGFLIATVVTLVLVLVAIFFLTAYVGQRQDAARQAALQYPELQDLRARHTDLIQNYAANDDGTFRIPLARAQQLLAQEFAAVEAEVEAPDSRIGFNLAFPRTMPGRMAAPGTPVAPQDVGEAAPPLPPPPAAEDEPTAELTDEPGGLAP